jgi:hypothetical protein
LNVRTVPNTWLTFCIPAIWATPVDRDSCTREFAKLDVEGNLLTSSNWRGAVYLVERCAVGVDGLLLVAG